MKTHRYQMRRAQIFVGACLGLSIVDIAACSSSDSAQGGKPVEYGHWAGGVDAGDAGFGTDGAAPRRVSFVVGGERGDAGDAGRTADGGKWSSGNSYIGDHAIIELTSEFVERDYGVTLSPLDKERVNTCPRRAWSKNVPDLNCTKDDECGDGICDRGHCSAIYTCVRYPGSICVTDAHCRGLCMEGRCRSCVSDAECQKKSMNPFAACDAPGSHPPGRSCAASRWVRPDEEPALKAHCDAAPAGKKPPYCPVP